MASGVYIERRRSHYVSIGRRGLGLDCCLIMLIPARTSRSEPNTVQRPLGHDARSLVRGSPGTFSELVVIVSAGGDCRNHVRRGRSREAWARQRTRPSRKDHRPTRNGRGRKKESRAGAHTPHRRICNHPGTTQP